MSKDTHGFSVSVACEVGERAAIILQHLCFLQKSSISAGENWQQKWVRRSAAAMAKTYPYWTAKQISAICDNLEKGEYLFSKIENTVKTDRSKSYLLTSKGLLLMGEIPFAEMENGFSKKVNANAETENVIYQNGGMTIKVDYTSFVPSFVEEKDAALFSSSENENQTLKAEKEKKGLQGGAALLPPFTPTGETIEPQPTRYVKLYDLQEPNLTLVEPAPPLEYQRNPRETPPAELRRVNIQEAVEAMRNDQTALEGFVIGRKLPRERFAEYLSEFEAEQTGLKTQYKNERDLRLHFLNWSGVHHQIAQKRKTQSNGKGSSLTHAGGDLSKYEQKQIF